MLKVVAALIENEGKVLIAKRNEGSDYTNGKWEFPGGKVELNEDELTAIQREIKEEFELDVKAKEFITNNVHEYPHKTIDLRLYKCEYVSGEFKLNAHLAYEWVDKQELLNYDLCPADIPLAQFVIEN